MTANLALAAMAGLAGAAVMTVFIYIFRGLGITLDIPYLIGTRFVPVEKRSTVYATGILLHLLLGTLWGIVYVYFMTAMAVSPDWPAGILFGFSHGIFTGAIVGTLARNHPQIGSDKPIRDPGMFGNNWGKMVPYLMLLLHIIFGVVAMLTYDYFNVVEQIPRM